MRTQENIVLNVLLYGLAITSAVYSLPASAALDPVHQPAQISPQATHLAQLGLARAGNRLVSVGERGVVLLSDDNGANWRQAAAPVSVTLTNVCFADPRHGWAVGHGGVVLATEDGGQSWKLQLDGNQAAALELRAAKAAEVANARRVADAERLVAEGADKPFFDVHFFNERRGLIVGAYGLAFSTGDGGAHWESIGARLDNPKGHHLYAIAVAGAQLYVAGEQGALYRSADAGHSFTAMRSPASATFFGLVTGAPGELVAYGLRGNAYRSGDSGNSWERLAMAPITLTAGARLADGSLALTDEAGRVLHSSDGGRSFRVQALARPAPLSGIVQASDGVLILSSTNGVGRYVLSRQFVEGAK